MNSALLHGIADAETALFAVDATDVDVSLITVCALDVVPTDSFCPVATAGAGGGVTLAIGGRGTLTRGSGIIPNTGRKIPPIKTLRHNISRHLG